MKSSRLRRRNASQGTWLRPASPLMTWSHASRRVALRARLGSCHRRCYLPARLLAYCSHLRTRSCNTRKKTRTHTRLLVLGYVLHGDDDAPASACPRVMCASVCASRTHPAHSCVPPYTQALCLCVCAQEYRSPCTPAAASSMSEKSSTLLGPVATGARPPAQRLCCSSQSSPTSSLGMLPMGIRDGPISPPSDTAVIRSPILLYPVRRAADDAVVMRSALVMRSASSQELPVSLCQPRHERGAPHPSGHAPPTFYTARRRTKATTNILTASNVFRLASCMAFGSSTGGASPPPDSVLPRMLSAMLYSLPTPVPRTGSLYAFLFITASRRENFLSHELFKFLKVCSR